MKFTALFIIVWVGLSFPVYSENVIVFAPHPDDEILGASSVIKKAVKENTQSQLLVVFFTCGDGHPTTFSYLKKTNQNHDLNDDGQFDYVDVGIHRCRESIKALNHLGLQTSQIRFLGFPDGGLKFIFENETVFKSERTLVDHVPYDFAQSPQAKYDQSTLMKILNQIITDFKPQKVYTPTITDHHPDHHSVRMFVSSVLQSLHSAQPISHFEYLVHWEQIESGWPQTSSTFGIPKGHIPPGLRVELGPLGFDHKFKLEVLEIYESQMGTDRDYLSRFAKEDEMFWLAREKRSDYILNSH